MEGAPERRAAAHWHRPEQNRDHDDGGPHQQQHQQQRGKRPQRGEQREQRGGGRDSDAAQWERGHLQPERGPGRQEREQGAGRGQGQGQVRALKEQFGFIQCIDRPGDLFFHLSSAPEGLQVGDEVSFSITVSNRSNRESAVDLQKLPAGTIKWEVEIVGTFRGVVERDLHVYGGQHDNRHDNRRGGGRGGRPGQGGLEESVEGTIRIVGAAKGDGAAAEPEAAAAAAVETAADAAAADTTAGSESKAEPFSAAAAAAAPSLEGERVPFNAASMAVAGAMPRRGDEVEFRLTEFKGSGRKRATEVKILQSARRRHDDEQARGLRERGAAREQGTVVRLNGDYGFIRASGRDENLYFVIDAVDQSWLAVAAPTAAAAGAAAAAASSAPPPPPPPLRIREGTEVEFWTVKIEEAARDGRPNFRAVGVSTLPHGTVAAEAPLQLGAVGIVAREPGGDRDQRRPGMASFPGVTPPASGGGGGGSGSGGGGCGSGGSGAGSGGRQGQRAAAGVMATFGGKDMKGACIGADGAELTEKDGVLLPFVESGDEIRADLFLQKSSGRISARNVTVLRLREPRDEGVVSSIRDNFGFIRCATREGEVFFRLREVFGPKDAATAISDGAEVRFNVVASDRGEKARASRVEILPKGSVWWQKTLATGVAGVVARPARGQGASGSIGCEDAAGSAVALPAEPPAAEAFPRLYGRLEAFAAALAANAAAAAAAGEAEDGAAAATAAATADPSELCFPRGQLSGGERKAAREFAAQHDGIAHADLEGIGVWLWREGAEPPAPVANARGSKNTAAAAGSSRAAAEVPPAAAGGEVPPPAAAAAGEAAAGAPADTAAPVILTLPYGRIDYSGREPPGAGDKVSFDVVWDRALQRRRATNIFVTEAAPENAGGGGGGGGGAEAQSRKQQHQQQQRGAGGQAAAGAGGRGHADEEDLPGIFRGVVAVPPRRGTAEGFGDGDDKARGAIAGVVIVLPEAAAAVAGDAAAAGQAPPPQQQHEEPAAAAAAIAKGEDGHAQANGDQPHEEDNAEAHGTGADGGKGGGGKHKTKRKSSVSSAAHAPPATLVAPYRALHFNAGDLVIADAAAADSAAAEEDKEGGEVQRGDVVEFAVVRNRRHKMLRAKAVRIVQRGAAVAWRATVAYVDEGDSKVGLTAPHRATAAAGARGADGFVSAAAADGSTDAAAAAAVTPVKGSAAGAAAAAAGSEAGAAGAGPLPFFYLKDMVGPAAPVRLHDEIDFLLLLQQQEEQQSAAEANLAAAGEPPRAMGPVRVQDLGLLKSTRRGFNTELRAALRMQTPLGAKAAGGAGRMAHGPDGTRGFAPGWRSRLHAGADGEAKEAAAAAAAEPAS